MASRPKQRHIPYREDRDYNPELLTVLAWADQEIVFGLENGTIAQGTKFERTLQAGRWDWGHWGFRSAANPEDASMILMIGISGNQTIFISDSFIEDGMPFPVVHKFWEALFYQST